MFRAPSQEMLDHLLKKAINDCSGNTNCVSTLIKFMEKQIFGQHISLIVLKEILVYVVLRSLNQITAVLKKFVSQYLEGIHGAM